MTFEIPADLIQELRSQLRQSFGVPESSSTTSTVPSIPEIIADLDPDVPPILRCHVCKGPLIRGSRSTVCIYCGTGRRGVAEEHSLKFKSTAACRKFLDSLQLDGSEIITLESKTRKPNRNEDSPKTVQSPESELVLLDLLDLDICWPPATEKADIVSISEATSQSVHALNLSGVDLDTFFTDKKSSSVFPINDEEIAPEKQTGHVEAEIATGSSKSDLIYNVQSSEMKVSSVDSKEDEVRNHFTHWEADFQSVGTKVLEKDLQAIDLFQDLSAAESANFESTIETVSQLQDSEKVDCDELSQGKSQLSAVGIEDDPWSEIHKGAVVKSASGETDIVEVKNNPNETHVTNSQNDMWLSSTKESDGGDSLKENDVDSFDTWQDFTSSAKIPEDPLDSVRKNDEGTTSYKDALEMNPVDQQDLDFGDFVHSDSLGVVADNKLSTTSNSINLGSSKYGYMRERGSFNAPQAVSDPAEPQEQGLSDSMGKNDLRRVMYDEPLGISKVEVQDIDSSNFFNSDSLTAAANIKSSIELNNASENVGIKEHSFDAWTVLTNPAEVQSCSNSKRKSDTGTASYEEALGRDQVDAEDIDFGDFIQSDSLGAVDNDKNSTKFSSIQLDSSRHDSKEVDNVHDNKAPSQSPHQLNLSVVDLDTFFTDLNKSSSAFVKFDEQVIPVKQMTQTETNTASGSDEFSLFESIRPSDMKMVTFDNKGGDVGDSSADWEGNFQSAGTKPLSMELQSFDLFEGFSAPANPLSTLETISQTRDVKDAHKEPAKVKSLVSSVDWLKDDLWSQTNKEVICSSVISETSNIEVEETPDDAYGNSRQNEKWFGSDSKEYDKSNSVKEDNDSFGAWQDYTRSRKVPQDQAGSARKSDAGTDDSFDAWQDYTSSSKTPHDQSDAVRSDGVMAMHHEPVGIHSMDIQDIDFGDFIQSDSIGDMVHNRASSEFNRIHMGTSLNDSLRKGDDSFDALQDFTSSVVAPQDLSDPLKIDLGTAMHGEPLGKNPMDSQDIDFGNFIHSGFQEAAYNKSSEFNSIQSDISQFNNIKEHDDSFDSWQDFTSSSIAPQYLSDSARKRYTETAKHGDLPENNLVYTQDNDFGHFVQSGFLQATVENKNSSNFNSIELDSPGNGRLNMLHARVTESLEAPGALRINGDPVAASNLEVDKQKVEMLSSKMLGLSVMRKNELSTPKSPQNSG